MNMRDQNWSEASELKGLQDVWYKNIKCPWKAPQPKEELFHFVFVLFCLMATEPVANSRERTKREA